MQHGRNALALEDVILIVKLSQTLLFAAKVCISNQAIADPVSGIMVLYRQPAEFRLG
jgi:hypothetical protein